MSDRAAASNGFGVFAQLTRALRHAPTHEALQFSIVNETRRLILYQRAVLLRAAAGGRLRVAAISGIPVVDRQSALVQWIERTATLLARDEKAARTLHPLDLTARPGGPFDATVESGWRDLGSGHALWCPLLAPSGELTGALWLERAGEPWREAEFLLIGELADAQAHALAALPGGRRVRRRHGVGPLAAALLAAVAAGLLAVPVRRSALAPAEIVAQNPEVIAAPIDGVLRSFAVKPNQTVAPGDLLFTLDDTDHRARVDVAAKALDVARVEYRQASQGALGGRRDAPKLASLEAQVALKEIELDNARRQLERTQARAGRAGVAVLPDTLEWIGRPVTTGERVMLVVDPAQAEARAWLPVRDAMPLEPGTPVRIFLDVDPLTPLDGRLVRANLEAEEVPGGGLAYRAVVALDGATPGGEAPPRIGLKGTARIEGDRVPLAFYLFRRPLAALRQAVGL